MKKIEIDNSVKLKEEVACCDFCGEKEKRGIVGNNKFQVLLEDDYVNIIDDYKYTFFMKREIIGDVKHGYVLKKSENVSPFICWDCIENINKFNK